MASSCSSIRSSTCRSTVVDPSDACHVNVDLPGGASPTSAGSSKVSASKTSSPLGTGGVFRSAVAVSMLIVAAAVGCLYSSMRWQSELGLIRAVVASQAARHANEMERLQGELAKHANQLEELRIATGKPCHTKADSDTWEADLAEKDMETAVATVGRDEQHYRRLAEDVFEEFAAHRRLNVYMNIKAHNAMEKNSGCVTVDLSGGNVALALNTKACNSRHCPSCFIIKNAHATNKLQLTGCSSGYISETHQIGTTTGWVNGMMSLLFINIDTGTPAIIGDNSVDSLVSASTSATAFCYTHANNKLHFPSHDFPALKVTGNSELTGTLDVKGQTTLGDQAADTVTIKGNVVGDATENPSLDFSGSTAIFKSGTGQVTLGGNAVLSGSLQVDGDVTLGDAKADTILFKGDITADGTANPDIDFSGSSGLFKASTGVATIGGAVTFSGNAQIDGNAVILGTTQLGDQKADTVTIKADVVSDATTDPVFDLSASAGQFKTSVGQNTLAGNIVAAAGVTANFGAAVTLGAAKTDDITFKGSIKADGTAKPDFDFSLSTTGTFATSGGASTIGGAVTMAGNARIDGNVDVRGTTTLGNANGDTVTIKGHVVGDATTNPNFDFSGSTGTFLSGTGANTIGGDVTLAGTTTMSGALTLNAAATLGAEKTDQIKFKGDIKADGTANPVLDFSASTGAFKTPTGTSTIAGLVRFNGQVDFKGDVNLGDQKADAITFLGDVTASGTTNPDIDFSGTSGTFAMPAGTITIGGATTFSQGVTVQGALTTTGAVTMGDQKTDSIVVKGSMTLDGTTNPDLDLSGSTGLFNTPTGVSTVKGNLAIDGTTNVKGQITLGDQKADTITIKADLVTSTQTDPDIDFTASNGQCTANFGGLCSR
mmetsp:Transcript_105753/g.203289  ORF Transcript_105753/g.203289 Transcript_105753/m.203289 type:complete len:886 (-) Transcript_105753:84-2741(-)